MRRTTGLLIGAALLVLAGLALQGLPVGAQRPQQAYTLDWWTVDGGGATFSAGGDGYTLGGTAGQPDAGVLSGGDGYTVDGGFWNRGLFTGAYRIYLPLLMRDG